MHPQTLHIGTYILQPYARTEAHIRDLAACGIDRLFGIEHHRETLDLLHQYHIGAIVTGVLPGWFGGTGDNAGQLRATNPPEAYLDALRHFCDHPAIVGLDVGDEPSCADFPYYGEVLRFVRSAFPDKVAYLNLYPSYGMLAANTPEQTRRELGAADYTDYIRQYCHYTDTDYLSFDHYVYASDAERFLCDLHTVATACRETQRELWVVLQVNSHDPRRWLSINQLRYQAFSALAFGAVFLTWACYTAGWWYNPVLDGEGNKTEQYIKLQQVNSELRRVAPVTLGYRWERAHRLSLPGEAADTGVFRQLHTADGEPLLAGWFTSRENPGAEGLFLCACGDPADEHPHTVPVKFWVAAAAPPQYHSPTETFPLSPDADGWYSLPIPTCSGGFLTIDATNGQAV